jgi:hypothetical protein
VSQEAKASSFDRMAYHGIHGNTSDPRTQSVSVAWRQTVTRPGRGPESSAVSRRPDSWNCRVPSVAGLLAGNELLTPPRLPWTSFLFSTWAARRRAAAGAVHSYSQNLAQVEAPNWAWFDMVGMDAPAWASTDGANADLEDIEGAHGTEAASCDETLLASCHESEMEETVCQPVDRVPRRLARVPSRARLLDLQLVSAFFRVAGFSLVR